MKIQENRPIGFRANDVLKSEIVNVGRTTHNGYQVITIAQK